MEDTDIVLYEIDCQNIIKVIRFAAQKIGGARENEFKGMLAEDTPSLLGQRIIVDLRSVEIMSSGPIGTLVALNRAVTKSGGGVVFTHVCPDIMKMFGVTRLDKVLHLADTVDTAREYFQTLPPT